MLLSCFRRELKTTYQSFDTTSVCQAIETCELVVLSDREVAQFSGVVVLGHMPIEHGIDALPKLCLTNDIGTVIFVGHVDKDGSFDVDLDNGTYHYLICSEPGIMIVSGRVHVGPLGSRKPLSINLPYC